MKIDKSKVYSANLYSVKNEDETIVNRNVIVVKFDELFVTVWNISNALSCIRDKKSQQKGIFLGEKLPQTEKEGYIIKNPSPVFKQEGEITLEELLEIQQENFSNSNTAF